MTDLFEIPGIGKTFVTDFSRINIDTIDDLVGQNPDLLFVELCKENIKVNHKTSKTISTLFVWQFITLMVAVNVINSDGVPGKTSKWFFHLLSQTQQVSVMNNEVSI